MKDKVISLVTLFPKQMTVLQIQLLRDSSMIQASRALVILHNLLNYQIAIHVILKLQGQTPQDLSPVRILDKSVGSSNYSLSWMKTQLTWDSWSKLFVCWFAAKYEENYDDAGKHFARKTIWFRKSNKVGHNEKFVCMPIYTDINLCSIPYNYLPEKTGFRELLLNERRMSAFIALQLVWLSDTTTY